MARLAEQHRYVDLCAALAAQSPAERREALRALCAAGTEDPHVVFLLQWRWALPPDPDRDRSGEHMGRYTLCELLAEGGGGIVYRAEQPIGPHRREVAVKLLHPTLLQTARDEAQARFLAEMGTLIKLEHEGIARIYDGGLCEDPATHAQLPYIAMELVREGVPITTYAKEYALTWPERLALFLRVCRAVQYAHERRVVHRDLKPANILVDPEGHPVVIDFGLAQASEALFPEALLAVAGTPAYMSPEQVMDRLGPISAKSDVYALGLLLYELLTEQLPYALPRDGAVEELSQVILGATPLPLSRFNAAYGEELDAIVAAALAKRPGDRLSVAVLRSRLERSLQQLPPDRDRPRFPTAQPDLDQVSVESPPLPVRPEPGPVLSPAGGMSRGPGTAEYVMPDAERRQLTILFCDLVDSTQLASQRDPEEWGEVVRAYYQACGEVIQRFDGSLAQWLGDGFLVYFGWPQAHEDDALRAVRTGLGLLEVMEPLNTRLAHGRGLRLAVRVGIHTGLVVVGEMGGGGRQERLALGDTPNIASRLQGLATPDTVVISAATFHLVEGYFMVEDLGRHALKGVVTPLQVYQVAGASAAQSRLEVAAATGLTSLVGREADVALLCDRWAQSRDGQGQVVLLCGEAGIGKSRLVEVLTVHVRSEGALRMMFRCSPYHTNSAFFPVIAHLQQLLHWHTDESPEARVTTLEQALRPYGFALQDVVPLFAALLSVPLPERYLPLTLSPQRQKQQTQEALVAWLLAEAERQPVLVVWEDLHWADPSSLDFLSVLIEQTPTAPLLILLACRPEFAPPWPSRSHVTQLTLPRFTRSQIEEMVRHKAGGKRVPAEVVQQIVAKTDGIPLFVEELTKVIMESGLLRETAECYELTGPLPALAIPATLQDALMARLDRLGTAKGLAQLGATIGRQFAYDLLREVAQRDDMTMQRELGRVVEAELLYQRGQPPLAIYRFKHALIQDAAYQSLLRSTRQHYHQRIAQVLAERFPETAETQPELLAHHSTEAGLVEQAMGYWYTAGQRAHERSAHVEAIEHLRKGLALLTTLPDTPEHRQQELAVQITLGAALTATKGFAAPDVEAAYQRAHALCQQVGETPQLFPVLGGLARLYIGRGEYQSARELGEQLLSLAQCVHDPAGLAHAHNILGYALFTLQEWDAARTHVEQGVAFYTAPQHRSQGFFTDTHQGVSGLCRLSLVLWILGYPDQALQRSHEALTLARALAHPASVVFALYLVAAVHGRRGEWQHTYELAEAGLGLAREHGFAFRVAQATIVQGSALVVQGQGEAGLTQICQGLATLRTTGSETWVYRIQLAMAYWRVGQREKGLRVAEEGLAVSPRDTEWYRIKGELLLRGSAEHQAEADRCFRQALEIARRQQAKSLELRAAMSLGRLWQQQGKRAEARALLAPIYGWFTEGFDTADLKDAKELLDELAEERS